MADAKDSPMAIEAKSSSDTETLAKQQRNLLMAQDILRLLAIGFAAASIAIMVTNNQTVVVFSIALEAHFYYSSAFKFLVAANGVACVFSVLALILNFLLGKQGSQRKDYFFLLFIHDMAMTMLLIAGCAAASAIGYVGKYGEEHMGWQPLCEHVKRFCRTSSVSLFLSYAAFLAYLGLTVLTAYKCTSYNSPKN